MAEYQISGITIPSWIIVPVVFFLWVTILFIVKRLIFNAVKNFASKTKTLLDDIFIKAADFPLNLLIVTSGGAVVEQMLPHIGMASQTTELTAYFLIAFKATTIVAVILFIDSLFSGFIQHYAHKNKILKSSSGVTKSIVRVLVIGLGVLILMDSFGVSITPVIASLGIGSLAVALALQPTLENFFSGVQLLIDRPIKVGHFVKLESGEEGYVHRIGWRSTWIRLLPNNIVVIPNSNLVNSKILNYYYPQKEMAVLVQVGVHYDSDLERVERVTVEVGTEIMKTVKGAVETHQPFIRYHTFDGSSINFSVILRAREFVDNYLIKHEFIKALQKRFARESIVIPFPISAVNFSQENSVEDLGKLLGKK